MIKRSFFAALAALCVSVALFSCLNIDSYESDATTSLSLTFGNPSAAKAAVGRAADDAQDEFPKVVVKVEGDGVSQEKSVSYDQGNANSGARIDFDGLPAGTPLVVTAEYWGHDQIKVQEGSTTVSLRPGVVTPVTVTLKPIVPTESNLTLNVKFDGITQPQPTDLAKTSDYAKKWLNGDQYVGGYPVEFLIDVDVTDDSGKSYKQQINDITGTAVKYSGINGANPAAPSFAVPFDNLPAGTYTVKVTAVMNDCPATRPDGSIPSGTYSGTATVQIPQETTADVSMNYDKELPKLADVTANPPSNNGNTELTQDGQVTFSSSDGAKLTLSVSPNSDVEITDDTVTFNGAGTTYTVTAVASKSGHIPARNEFTYKTQTPIRPLEGNFSATAGGATISNNLTLPKGAQVKFDFSETGGTGGTPTLDLSVRKTNAAISASDIKVTSGGTYDNNGTVTGTGSSVTVTFNGTGSYSVTPTAKKSGHQDKKGTAVTFTVADFTTRVRLASGSADLATSDGNTSFTLGADAAELTVSLYMNGSLYTGGGVGNWSVTATDSSNTPTTITPTNNGANCSFNFPNVAVGSYTLSVQAAVYGTTVGPYQFTVRYTVPLGITFVTIQGATVNVSIGNSGGPFANASAVNVTAAPFRIAETELTYAKWYEVYQWATSGEGRNKGYKFANKGREGSNGTDGATPTGSTQPVTKVSWRDAVVWCNAASERAGLDPVYVNGSSSVPVRDSTTEDADNATPRTSENGYRLPTEAEWEFAARGGKPNDRTNWNYTYAGTSDQNQLSNYAVYSANSGSKTANVNTKVANSAGLYDMSGNVWEYCWDKLSDSSSNRVHRGGSYSDDATSCSVANRSSYQPNDSHFNLGFRVVRSGN